MKIIKIFLPLAILNLISLVLVTFTLPDIVPIHLTVGGVVDGFGSKWYIPVLGMIPLVLTTVYIFYRYYQKENENKSIEDKIFPLIIMFTVAITWIPVFISFNFSKNHVLDIITIVFIAIAILFIILGYYMGSIKRNKYLGIRTPWTLKDDIVWKKTHNLATYSYMVSGFVLIIYSIAGFISENVIYFFIGLAIALFLTVVLPVSYSYYDYRKNKDFNNL